jgi:hypothetical protein
MKENEKEEVEDGERARERESERERRSVPISAFTLSLFFPPSFNILIVGPNGRAVS